jgi:hypothetical protein
MNGEVRDRENDARFENPKYSCSTGLSNLPQLFSTTRGIEGKTPAEKCGMIIEGENKWKTVIENASKMSNQDI